MSVVGGALSWLASAQRLVPSEDRAVLLSPPRLVARFLKFAWHRHRHTEDHDPADDVRRRDPALVSLLLDLASAVGKRYFRLRVEGIEHVPASGPVLLVGNHNGALLPMDGFFTALAIRDRHGPGRPLYALAHDFLFKDPLLRSYALRLGMLRACWDSARHAFDAGGCVIVYPGSDLDTYRTFHDRKKIVLGGRKGFLRLALRTGVPIVPVVSVGTHEQLLVLARGDRLARLLHAHAWARTEVLPLVFALPWGITTGFVPYLPLPAQTTVAFGPPITWPDLGPAAADDPEALERCYRDVESRMQAMLDRLSLGRRFLLGKREEAPSA